MRRRLLRLGVCAAVITLGLVALRVAPHAPLSAQVPASTAFHARGGELLRLTLATDGQVRLWTPLDRIAPTLVDATLLYEDQHFRLHPGVNPVALVRALLTTYAGGGRRLGGSTLTMQLARRLYGIDSRTPGGKLRQIAAALWLEARHSKRDILEAYLNVAPYGGNVEGAGAAALVTFGKPAARLDLAEALTLAVIPQSPTQRALAPSRGQGPAPALLRAREALWHRYHATHPEAARDEAAVALPPVTRAQSDLPFRAPHFVDQLLAEASPPTGDVTTTLDWPLQRLVERQIRQAVARGARIGIHNAAALLVDTRTMDVRALVGSVDFFDDAIAGQVSGVTARRSPGSTLKPFVYALGMEQGAIHPLTMLKDVPIAFSAYSPENFDGRFVGPLAARDALVRSRNIPAITIAAKLNDPSLYGFLTHAGVQLRQDEAHYGLGLVLGAGEVTMEELITLYGALANRGVLHPLRRLASDPVPTTRSGTRVLGVESAWLVLDMLSDNPRPDRGTSAAAVDDRRFVAWKTGTSWGFRDAWTVGVFGPFALAVWVGDFSGDSNPAFVGIQAAAPLFFSIVDAIDAQARGLDPELPRLLAETRPPPPATLQRVALCALTGQLPGPHCPHTHKGWFIPGRSPIDTCQIHRDIVIDVRTGQRVCGPPTGPVRHEVQEVWPTDLLKLFAAAGLPRRTPPPPGPGCDHEDATSGLPPRITSPLRGVTYTLRNRRTAAETIALSAETDGDAREVFWYVDRALEGKSRSGAPFFWRARPGHFLVRAVDDRGRADAREVTVEVVE